MKFVCERCHTKYSIADEKVRGKVLKVRCKTCANVVTVRETGATTDDSVGTGPKAAPFSKSGSVESTTSSARKPAELPSEALVAPGAPVPAPPPRKSRATAPITPPSPIEGIEWYLAVDGAQTGPFPQSRLCDKILALPAGVDVHVWNGTFDTWKPPQTVPELQAELSRRRRAPTPHAPPPPRRPSGAVPLAAASSARSASVGLAEIEPGPPLSKSQAPAPKTNGVPNGAAGAAAPALAGFGLGDLVGEADGTATPLPVALTGVAPGHAAPALGPGVRQTRPSVAALARFEVSGPVHVVRTGVRPIKLVLLGALGVAIVVCGIVGVWMFRKPAPAAAVAVETPPKPVAADFAGLAEKLAKEEAAQPPPPTPTVEVKPKPEEAPPAVVDVKAATGSPAKGTRRSRRKNQAIAPPPLGLGATPTQEEREAASRFGDSTGRDVKLAAQAGGGSRSTTPAQADISRVINNNRQGIQTCYQRALLRDNTLTHGKVTVRVSIGLSGKVKSVSLDAPVQFRALEPCIREVMSRWAFPPSSEEYGTEFPVVLQGNQ